MTEAGKVVVEVELARVRTVRLKVGIVRRAVMMDWPRGPLAWAWLVKLFEQKEVRRQDLHQRSRCF